jgi:hypothetical protein
MMGASSACWRSSKLAGYRFALRTVIHTRQGSLPRGTPGLLAAGNAALNRNGLAGGWKPVMRTVAVRELNIL